MKNKRPPEELIAAALLALMVALVFCQVVSRYVIHTSLSFSEELVRYLSVWATFLGAAAAVRRSRHLAITGVVALLPEKWRRRIRLMTAVGGLLFVAIIGWKGFDVVRLEYLTDQRTAALGMPIWPFGAAIPVCALLIGYRIISACSDDLEER